MTKIKTMLSGVEPRKNFIELLKELELSMHNVMFFIALFTGVYVYGIPSLNQHLIKYTPIHNIFLSLKKYLNIQSIRVFVAFSEGWVNTVWD